MGGGRIIRDKLWFYTTYRETCAENTIPGMWFNKNAGNPNAWTVDFDRISQAFSDSRTRNGIARLTWQVTPRNKVNLHWSEQDSTNSMAGGGTATTTPEAAGLNSRIEPSHVQQGTWSSPSPAGCCSRRAGARTRRDTATWRPALTGRFNPR